MGAQREDMGAQREDMGARDGWRRMFDAGVGAGRTLGMRADLRRGGDALTETWIYQVTA
jgi:glucan biosynthesis protein